MFELGASSTSRCFYIGNFSETDLVEILVQVWETRKIHPHCHTCLFFHHSGQISSRPHTTVFPQMVVFVREIPGYFREIESRLVKYHNLVLVLNICNFQRYRGKWSNLTNIFQMGWNHQPVIVQLLIPLFFLLKCFGNEATEVSSLLQTPTGADRWDCFGLNRPLKFKQAPFCTFAGYVQITGGINTNCFV